MPIKGDILSGTDFSTTIDTFTDKTLYEEYGKVIFDPSMCLRLYKSQNKTLKKFLNDVRQVRNKFAHHKKVTSADIALVNLYYEEITSPIQQAFDAKKITVDPAQFFNVDSATLDEYFSHARKILDTIGLDVGEIKPTLSQQGETVGSIKHDTGFLRRKMTWVLGGLGIVALVGFMTFGTSTKTLLNTDRIREGGSDVQSKIENVKKETSTDPRKELVNRGVTWSSTSFEDAIHNADEPTIRLFLDGGMKWNLQTLDFFLPVKHYGLHDIVLREPQETPENKAILNDFFDHVQPENEKNICFYVADDLIPNQDNFSDFNVEQYMTPYRK